MLLYVVCFSRQYIIYLLYQTHKSCFYSHHLMLYSALCPLMRHHQFQNSLFTYLGNELHVTLLVCHLRLKHIETAFIKVSKQLIKQGAIFIPLPIDLICHVLSTRTHSQNNLNLDYSSILKYLVY